MNLTKKLTALLSAALVSVSCFSFTASAVDEDALNAADELLEQEAEEMAEEATESSYIRCGDYSYSLDDYFGETGAYLEEYFGSETEVVIPDEIDGYPVVGLGDGTFYFKEDITKITIPASLGDFGYYCFYGCTSLMEFEVDEAHEIYETDEDGAIVGKDGLAIMAFPTGKNPETYTVPEGIVAINSSCFAMCSNLKEITFPESLEFIGNHAFAECTSLETVTLPEKLTAIGNYTFSGCTALKEVNASDNLTKIGNASFFECTSLEYFDFPSALTEIGQAAFVSTGMTSVTIPATITTIGYSAFGFTTDEEDQIIPKENFVVMGYTGSYAQTYCTEHEVEFIALDEEIYLDDAASSTTSDNTEKESKIPVKKIAIIGGIAAGVIVIIAAALGFNVKKKNGVKASSDDEENEEDKVDMPSLSELCNAVDDVSETEEEK